MPLRFWPTKRDNDDPAPASRFELERVGRTRMDDVVSSTREIPWVLTLLQLLWTAGPVTWLAIQGGSLLGYGEVVATPTYLFFAFYIVIAAIIGVFARSAAQGIRKAKAERAHQAMTRTLDVLPELMFTLRDLQLQSMPPHQRQQHAASMVLRKTDLGPEGVVLAIEELSGSQQLAAAARGIDIYRRLGMYSRMNDLVEQSKEHRQAIVDQIYPGNASIARLLEQRLRGEAPSQDEGISRRENFIDHILSAAQHSNPDLMDLQDAEELITLTYELICGRVITRLTLGFAGDFQRARALDDLEHQHNEYRLISATVTHLLRSLAGQLSDIGVLATAKQQLPHDPTTLQHQCLRSLELLSRETIPRTDNQAHQQKLRQLKQAIISGRRAYAAIGRLHDRYRKYQKAAARWTSINASNSTDQAVSRQGIRIRESSIALNNDHKVTIATAFCHYLDEEQLHYRKRGLEQRGEALTAEAAKRLATQLTLILDPIINISDASVQRAIESSNAAYFEGLESHFSADAKLGLGSAVVKEVRQRLDKVSEVLVLRLARRYGLSITEANIDFLVQHYEADRERLHFISTQSQTGDDVSTASMNLPSPALPQQAAEWKRALSRAERSMAWADR